MNLYPRCEAPHAVRGRAPAWSMRKALPPVVLFVLLCLPAPGPAAEAVPLELTIAPRELAIDAGRVVYQEALIAGRSASPWDSLVFYLHLPDDFSLVPGSLELAGDTLGVVATGNPVVAALPALPPGGEMRLRYALRPASPARAGRHVVQAHVTRGSAWFSANAVSGIDLGPGEEPEQETFYGSVYHDRNENGKRDGGEEGVAGIGILLEDGSKTVTDPRGQFAFRVYPGTHLVTLDPGTIPAKAHLVGYANRLHDVSVMALAPIEYGIASRAASIEGIAAHGGFAEPRAVLILPETAKAGGASNCEELTRDHREAWGGYFVLGLPDDRARFERLKNCPPMPPVELAEATASREAVATGAPPPPEGEAQDGANPAGARPATAHASHASAKKPATRPARSTPIEPPREAPADSAALVTLEVGQKMFGMSSETLSPGFEDMLGTLGALFHQKGLDVTLRPAAEDHRDGPSNGWLEEKRLKIVEDALEEGRKNARAEPEPGGAALPPSASRVPPRALIESMTYAEAEGRARLLVTLSAEVPYASGGIPPKTGSPAGDAGPAAGADESALLLVLHTALAPEFRMPEIPEGAVLRRVSLDLTDQNGSLLLVTEPRPGTTCRVRTLRDPFRIEMIFEPKLVLPAADPGRPPATVRN
jgi:hypothetical protein